MSPCISFNKVNTFAWFKQRALPIGDDHDTADFDAALKLAAQQENPIPTGLLYRVERPIFGDHLTALHGETIVKRTATYTPERIKPLAVETLNPRRP